MAPIVSHQDMASDDAQATTNSTYLVILKVHGSNIRLFEGATSSLQTVQPSYRILCKDLENRRENHLGSGVQVFVLDKPETTLGKNLFQNQQLQGQEINASDLAIFMTSPIDSTRKALYAIDVGVSRHSTSMEDLSGEDCKRVGTAYIYLEPKFSTQGIQRVQIVSVHTKAPIGQMQIEYLIVTNPNGYGVNAQIPSWISPIVQLDAGHRGAGSGCRADLQGCPVTENTIASFNYAARHGADMVELDVMCTADGVPVVFHNYILNTKKPVQIDELTLHELRHLGLRSIHDENCKHQAPCDPQELSRDNQPFPTLEEVLRGVDKSCALNIELKWAQMLPSGKSEAAQYREINDFVDRIMDCIRAHSHGRPIVLSTFNANIAIMLRLKQTTYPVLFLTTGDAQRFHDPTTKTVKNAIHFAQAFDMAGVNPNAKALNEFLVRYAKDRNLLMFAWGDIRSAQTVKELKRYGLDGVIYDKIDLIKPQD